MYIRSLIAKGATESQIEADLVVQYGPKVLDVPKAGRAPARPATGRLMRNP